MNYSADGNFKNKIIEKYEDAPTNVSIFNLKIGDIGNGADWPSISHKDRANTNDFALSQNKDGTTILNAPTDKSLHFRLGNEDKMVLKNNNVGIGISDPETKLHVDGKVTASEFVDSDGILTASEKLCIGETCVTEEELKDLLANNENMSNTHIGNQGHADAWQGISNKNNANTTNFALIQHNDGRTILNSKNGKKLLFRQGNINKMLITTTGDVEINNSLNVKNGINVEGSRSYFKDMGNKGRLRVGEAWNIPGIYSEDNEDIVLGVNANRTAHIGSNNKFMSVKGGTGDVDIKGKLCIDGMCLNQSQIKHLLKDYYFTSKFIDKSYGTQINTNNLQLDVNYTESLPNDVYNDIILSATAARNDHYTNMIKCLPYVQIDKTVEFSVYAKGAGKLELFIFQGSTIRGGFFSSQIYDLTDNWQKFTFERLFTESNNCTVRFDLNNLNDTLFITGIRLEIK